MSTIVSHPPYKERFRRDLDLLSVFARFFTKLVHIDLFIGWRITGTDVSLVDIATTIFPRVRPFALSAKGRTPPREIFPDTIPLLS